jgi:uncharacterized membrane protein YgcG
MHNKNKNWNDIKLILSSFSVALTLGIWGLFASQEKSGKGVTGEAVLPPQPDPLVSAPPAALSSSVLLPGQILLFGGTNLQSAAQLQSQATAQPTPVIVVRKKHGGRGDGGGGGGGGGGSVTSSGSSHP